MSNIPSDYELLTWIYLQQRFSTQFLCGGRAEPKANPNGTKRSGPFAANFSIFMLLSATWKMTASLSSCKISQSSDKAKEKFRRAKRIWKTLYIQELENLR